MKKSELRQIIREELIKENAQDKFNDSQVKFFTYLEEQCPGITQDEEVGRLYSQLIEDATWYINSKLNP